MSAGQLKKRYDDISRLIQKHRFSEAIQESESLIAAHPNDAHLLYLIGQSYHGLNRHLDAIKYFKAALAENPSNTECRFYLGDTLRVNRQLEDASNELNSVIKEQPNHFRALLALGLISTSIWDWEKASAHFQNVVRIKPSFAPGHGYFAEALAMLDRTDEATKHIRKAISLEPKNGMWQKTLASIMELRGDKQGAIDALKASLKHNPDLGIAYLDFVSANKVKDPKDPIIRKMEKKLESPMPSANREAFHFALMKAYNDSKQWDKAFEHANMANLILRDGYSDEFHRNFVNENRKFFQSSWFSKREGLGNPSEIPVFVVGMPRSGTTLIDQVLSRHSKIGSIGESSEIETASFAAVQENGLDYSPKCLTQLDEQVFNQLADQYLLKATTPNPGCERIIDKFPANFFNLGYIHTIFPNAKIIHSMRHPLDSCLSCYFQRFTQSTLFAQSSLIDWANDMESLGKFYRMYWQMMEHWKSVMPDHIIDIRYADMVQNLEATTRSALEFLGMEWEDQCLEFYKSDRTVHTASTWQVRQPIYTSSLARWKPYAKHLGPLAESLGDVLTDEDYNELEKAGLTVARPSRFSLKRLFGK
ncbi:MAG: tetratricopeptide repeat-containing sulfotransferase family protein [bacterium]